MHISTNITIVHEYNLYLVTKHIFLIIRLSYITLMLMHVDVTLMVCALLPFCTIKNI